MANTITGNDGSITCPTAHGTTGQSALIYMWRLSFENTIVNTTGFGNTVAETNRGGLLDVSGSAVGMMDDASASSPGVDNMVVGGSAYVFTVDTSTTIDRTYSFTAVVSSITIESNKRSNDATVTYDFIMGDTDALTESWADA